MAKLIMRIKGFDGTIDLMNDRVVINRIGLLNAMKFSGQTRREIPLAAISEIAFKPATVIGLGEIEFVRGGRSTEEKMRVDSIVRFRKRHNNDFETFKEKVFELMQQFNHQR
ncbi:MAG: hypothetical protein EBR02_04315 [Alphaproteobacteria bacterium]|nr:hypothetical protein [Alphaproteobacteria bacterium]